MLPILFLQLGKSTKQLTVPRAQMAAQQVCDDAAALMAMKQLCDGAAALIATQQLCDDAAALMAVQLL